MGPVAGGVEIVVLAVRRNWGWISDTVGDPRRLALLSGAACAIAGNWGTYIWAVNNGHVVEASLGYFINPLVFVALGVLVLRSG
ncbi:MAG: hypothetical protein ACRDPK_10810 [Carbonactinosporaceae bacterium]